MDQISIYHIRICFQISDAENDRKGKFIPLSVKTKYQILANHIWIQIEYEGNISYTVIYWLNGKSTVRDVNGSDFILDFILNFLH